MKLITRISANRTFALSGEYGVKQLNIADHMLKAIEQHLNNVGIAYNIAVCGGAVNDWLAGHCARDVDIVLCIPNSSQWNADARDALMQAAELVDFSHTVKSSAEYKDCASYMRAAVDCTEIQVILAVGKTLKERMAEFPCSKSMVCAVPTARPNEWDVYALWLWRVCEAAGVLMVGGNRYSNKYTHKMQCKYPALGQAVRLALDHEQWQAFATGACTALPIELGGKPYKP